MPSLHDTPRLWHMTSEQTALISCKLADMTLFTLPPRLQTVFICSKILCFTSYWKSVILLRANTLLLSTHKHFYSYNNCVLLFLSTSVSSTLAKVSHGIWKSLNIFFLEEKTHLKYFSYLYHISVFHEKLHFLPLHSFLILFQPKLSSPIHKITHFKVTNSFNLSWQVCWYWCVFASLDLSDLWQKWNHLLLETVPSWLTSESPGFLCTPLMTLFILLILLQSPYPPSVSWSNLKYQSSLSAQLWIFYLSLSQRQFWRCIRITWNICQNSECRSHSWISDLVGLEVGPRNLHL